MERKQLVIIAATVFAWGVVMAALGQAAAIATAAPALGLTVQQVLTAVRAHNTPGLGASCDAGTG
ncbi:hypothetical protein [Streptomyces sp. NBC_01431]|uniref:hypothetical protein n=1 Tax=Streptomyces sp. NBC_01431 TaxID=2903863 RepID=UPI002E309E1F|nr:hypothetical protein [Streptomyces sp. NBC_01431]